MRSPGAVDAPRPLHRARAPRPRRGPDQRPSPRVRRCLRSLSSARVVQPEGHLDRPADEHWAGRLYMRRVSVYVTRALIATPLSANAVTALMLPVGLLAALSLSLPGLLAALGAVLLIQLKLLLDCCDGEVARWRGTTSIKGVYLDVLAHYSTEAALFAALGIRADGGWDSIGVWTAFGLPISVLVLLLKSETHLVHYALGRSQAGSQAGGDARGRDGEGMRLPSVLPAIRPFHAVEATLLILIAAVLDSPTDSLDWRPWALRGARRLHRRLRRRPPRRDRRLRASEMIEPAGLQAARRRCATRSTRATSTHPAEVSSSTRRRGPSSGSSVSSRTTSHRGMKMRRPGVEVPPHALVRMVAVEPQERDRLLPTRTDDLAAGVQKYAPAGRRPSEPCSGRRPPCPGAELPAPGPTNGSCGSTA